MAPTIEITLETVMDRLRTLETQNAVVGTRLAEHTAFCEERHDDIKDNLKFFRRMTFGILGATVLGLLGVVVELIYLFLTRL